MQSRATITAPLNNTLPLTDSVLPVAQPLPVVERELPGMPDLDRLRHALQARLTAGVSPAAVMAAFMDWAIHFGNAPTKQMRLIEKTCENFSQIISDMVLVSPEQKDESMNAMLRRDHRFSGEEWATWPFNIIASSFLLGEEWWNSATTNVRGVAPQHQRQVNFMTRQILDRYAPSNFFWTNPEVLATTIESSGFNLMQGWQNVFHDACLFLTGKNPNEETAYHVGKNLAVTPGKVVYRNRLIELIQYEPTTQKVAAEPILIVPAWIMKYYILDLSEHNSLVRYLVSQGHTVFMISWHNPTADDRDLGMKDYRGLGVMAALDAINAIVPNQKINACGYCLGGTLLAIAAAAMAQAKDDRLASVTLLAAQTDFSEAGELMLFIDESEVTYLEDMMWAQGYLDTRQMAGAFELLRSNDLIWSRLVHHYMLGQPSRLNDLMAWNADATRMPYRMHAEYLRQLFLENRLSRGLFEVNGHPIALNDIHVPVFVVSTTKDHIAPWKSVFKIHLLSDCDVTFVLTNGGHNAGIVSEPGHPGTRYQIKERKVGQNYIDPDRWVTEAKTENGSWWSAWSEWMKGRSKGDVSPPSLGCGEYKPVCDAPGTYVYEK